MNRSPLTGSLALLTLATLGCTGGRQSDALTRHLPFASRLELLDAEYELTLADEEVRRADAAVGAAREALVRAEHALDTARASSNADLAARTRLEFLRASDRLAQERLWRARAQASCSRLQYERDRLEKVARENAVAGRASRRCLVSPDGTQMSTTPGKIRTRGVRAPWRCADASVMSAAPAPTTVPSTD